jgi:hypothetical protein
MVAGATLPFTPFFQNEAHSSEEINMVTNVLVPFQNMAATIRFWSLGSELKMPIVSARSSFTNSSPKVWVRLGTRILFRVNFCGHNFLSIPFLLMFSTCERKSCLDQTIRFKQLSVVNLPQNQVNVKMPTAFFPYAIIDWIQKKL